LPRKEKSIMSTAPIAPGSLKPPPRHALGLPAGSVRAVLALLVVGMISLLIALPPTTPPRQIPPYLFYLLFIILGHFFAAHGHSIGHIPGQPSPLYLPRGLVRLAIIAALVGATVYSAVRDEEALKDQMQFSLQKITEQPFLPLVLLGGFLLGVIV